MRNLGDVCTAQPRVKDIFILLSRYKVNILANCDYSKCIDISRLIVLQPEGGLWFQYAAG